MGYYWIELLNFFQNNKLLAYAFAILLLLSYQLNSAGVYYLFNDYLYLVAISPGIALTRYILLEYNERKKRRNR